MTKSLFNDPMASATVTGLLSNAFFLYLIYNTFCIIGVRLSKGPFLILNSTFALMLLLGKTYVHLMSNRIPKEAKEDKIMVP